MKMLFITILLAAVLVAGGVRLAQDQINATVPPDPVERKVAATGHDQPTPKSADAD